MSNEVRTALMVLLPAMATAAVFLLLSWKPWQRGSAAVTHGYWGGPLALGLGFLAAFYFVAGARGYQLQDRWHWIAGIAFLPAIMGTFATIWRTTPGIRTGSAAALATICFSLLQPPVIAGPAVYWKTGFGVIVLASWIPLETIAEKRRGVTLPIVLMIVFAGLSIVLFQTQQAGFSLLAAAVAAMCGVALLVALLNPQFSFAHGGIHVIAAVLPALCMLGWFYNFSDVPIGPFVLIAASPFTLITAESKFVSRLRPWQGLVSRLALTSLPVVAAVVWTIIVSNSSTDDYAS